MHNGAIVFTNFHIQFWMPQRTHMVSNQMHQETTMIRQIDARTELIIVH